MKSNATECMNSVFKGARMLLITYLVNLAFCHTIQYFEYRRDETSDVLNQRDVYREYVIRKLKRWEKRTFVHSVISLIEKPKHLKCIRQEV